MRLACMAGSYLCSHAGFSPIWENPPTRKKILARCRLAEKRAAQGIVDPVFGYGELPGGAQKFGGPLAMAWGYFAPIDGINQIVGHTPGDDVRIKAGPSTVNLCIDVRAGPVGAMVQGITSRFFAYPIPRPGNLGMQQTLASFAFLEISEPGKK